MPTSVELLENPYACIYKRKLFFLPQFGAFFSLRFTVAFRLLASSPQSLRPQDLTVCSEAVLAQKRVTIKAIPRITLGEARPLEVGSYYSYFITSTCLGCEFSAMSHSVSTYMTVLRVWLVDFWVGFTFHRLVSCAKLQRHQWPLF